LLAILLSCAAAPAQGFATSASADAANMAAPLRFAQPPPAAQRGRVDI
jgi:hypothetical protein